MEFLGVIVTKYLFGDYTCNSQGEKLIRSKHFGSFFMNWFPFIVLLAVSSALFQTLYGEKFIAKHVLMKPLLSVYPLWPVPEQSWCNLYFLLLYKLSTVNAEISIGGLIFVDKHPHKFSWASIPTKFKPTKICTHKELATVITVSCSYPRKVISTKI